VTDRRCVVAGASGVVGLAAARRLAGAPGTTVVATSRRAPAAADLGHAVHVPLDLGDAAACDAFARAHRDTTHLVYAAVKEAPGLAPGWFDASLMQENEAMFAHLLDALIAHAPALRHVTLLQGTKAYGVHVDANVPIPCRENAPRHPHANFYFLQEDALRARAAAHGFGWTVLRPQIVFGDALGSNMNPMVAIAVHAALLRAAGEPLHWPGGARHVSEAADADLVAAVIDWAGTTDGARNEIFNVANGDVFVWRDLWPAIAAALGMEVGDDRPASLHEHAVANATTWAALVDTHGLRSPRDVEAVLGQSARYADMLLAGGRGSAAVPQLVSTVKLRRAGFTACVDTEEMVVGLLRRLQDRRIVPVR
jgi:nucleoside-diphosphate-sugar epimerase